MEIEGKRNLEGLVTDKRRARRESHVTEFKAEEFQEREVRSNESSWNFIFRR